MTREPMNVELQRIWMERRKTVRVHHPFDRRGRVPRRPRPGDDAAAGQDRRPVRGRPAAAAHARRDDHGRIRRLCAAHPRRAATPEEGSNDRGPARNFPAASVDRGDPRSSGKRLVRVLDIPAFILPAPIEHLRRALSRHRRATLYLDHIWRDARRDAARLRARLRARLPARHRRRALAAASSISSIPSSSCSRRCRRSRSRR